VLDREWSAVVSFEQKSFLMLFAVVFAWWWVVRRRERAAVALLLGASLLFYAYNHWFLLPILVAYAAVNWFVALKIQSTKFEARNSKRRQSHVRPVFFSNFVLRISCFPPKAWLWLGAGFNLVVLCYYKYTPLLVQTVADLLPPGAGPALEPGAFEHWSIPYGISFYAFTGIAYMVDVHRKTTTAEANFWRYALSACFFPHLVAGPILRPNEFLDKVRSGRLPTDPEAPGEATWLVARGFFKKLVVADRIGVTIDPFFAHVNDPTTAGVWALPYVWLYALQIYFDFSAYTDMARGFGLFFGYRWPENFDRPYLAANITDFWRRWHMTLSRFLRDYLYISLGGNRHGKFRTYLNLMLTMLLGGLWHGASWAFLVWGGLHGLFLILHRAWSGTGFAEWLNGRGGWARSAWHLAAVVLTFHGVCFAWCFFRLTRFADSLACVRKWVECDTATMWVGPWTDPAVWLALGLYAALAWAADALRAWVGKGDAPTAVGAVWGVRFATLALAALLAPTGANAAFIYFQF
jgi:D-alanyl-lipoteichoic acid acyltransferase DltB (MBOAT superfamily)